MRFQSVLNMLVADRRASLRRPSPPGETKPRPEGLASDELRKPLLKGRRGKLTRKQRKG